MRHISLGALLLAACGSSPVDSSPAEPRDSVAPPAPTTTTPTTSTCFTGETPVDTPDGPVPIGQLERGDLVWSVDPRTGIRTERPVAWVHEHSPPTGLDLVVGGTTVRTTASHPFWVPREKAFVPAGELTVGDTLLRIDGDQRSVVRLERKTTVARSEPVYDLSVDGSEHTFVAQGLLVHNKWFTVPEFIAQLVHAAPNLGPATVRVWEADAMPGLPPLQETTVDPVARDTAFGGPEPQYRVEVEVDSTVVYEAIFPTFGWEITTLVLVEGIAGPQVFVLQQPEWAAEGHRIQVVNGAVDGSPVEATAQGVTAVVDPAADQPLEIEGSTDPVELTLDAVPLDGIPELTVLTTAQPNWRSHLVLVDQSLDGQVDTVLRWDISQAPTLVETLPEP